MYNYQRLGNQATWATQAAEGAKELASAYTAIADAFKTTKTKELKEKVQGEGFAQYKSKSSFARILGVPTAKFEFFIKDYTTMMGLRKNKNFDEIEAYLRISQYASPKWEANNFLFDEKSGGTVNALIMDSKTDYTDNVINTLAVKVDGAFKLAPNVLIYQKNNSYAGGIYETQKEVREIETRQLSEDETKSIQAMMILNAMDIVCEKMGVPLKKDESLDW